MTQPLGDADHCQSAKTRTFVVSGAFISCLVSRKASNAPRSPSPPKAKNKGFHSSYSITSALSLPVCLSNPGSVQASSATPTRAESALTLILLLPLAIPLASPAPPHPTLDGDLVVVGLEALDQLIDSVSRHSMSSGDLRHRRSGFQSISAQH
ncbi:unnamed protein product [Ectocarpus fasciculatus]